MMFLFAGHSDKPLKSLISMAHEGNHICLHRFSFIYVMDDLWEDAYTCPINVMDCTTESAIYVMGLTVVEEPLPATLLFHAAVCIWSLRHNPERFSL